MEITNSQTYALPRGAAMRLALLGLAVILPAVAVIAVGRPQLAVLPLLAAAFVWFLTTPKL